MKSFLYLVLLIFVSISIGLVLSFVDPQPNGELSSVSIALFAALLALDVMFLYLFIISLFLRNRLTIYHNLRALLLGILISAIITLKIMGLLTLIIICILAIIYILSEITIYELSRK